MAERKTWVKGCLAVVAVLALAVGGAAVLFGGQLLGIAGVGAGYKSKIMCSSVFVSGRTQENVENVDLLATQSYPITATVDREKNEVVASMVGIYSKRAVYRDGLGCTVVVGIDDEELQAQAKAAPAPHEPPPTDMGWPHGSGGIKELPAYVDEGKLADALDFAFTDPEPDSPVGTRAVAIVHKGTLVAEMYAPGFGRDTPLLGWSMTKSVNAALVGIIVKQGKLDIMDPAPVPEWQGPGDPRGAITTDQLMRMSSGLKFIEEYEENITSDCNVMLFNSYDMAHFAASMPLAHEPDTVWSYSSGTTNILARIVRHKVGGTDEDYFAFPREELFGKLGMASAVLEPDPSGTFVGSSHMYATARDWARFGLLCLRDGVWDGERILPEGWIEYCTTPTPTAPEGKYGAQFWLNRGSPDDPGDRWLPGLPTDLYSARGHEGQYVTVVPSEDLVVVRLGFTPNHKAVWDHGRFIEMVLEAL